MGDIVYLSGATKNISEANSNNWRNEAMNILSWNNKFVGFNPNTYFNYTDKQPKTDKQCMTLFLNYLRRSKIVLVNLDWSSTSVGTGIELMLASELHIPIIGFTTDRCVYSWSKELCDYVIVGATEMDGLSDAINYINEKYTL